MVITVIAMGICFGGVDARMFSDCHHPLGRLWLDEHHGEWRSTFYYLDPGAGIAYLLAKGLSSPFGAIGRAKFLASAWVA
jgi:hypothetical protein